MDISQPASCRIGGSGGILCESEIGSSKPIVDERSALLIRHPYYDHLQ